jgi:hypothetical protein
MEEVKKTSKIGKISALPIYLCYTLIEGVKSKKHDKMREFVTTEKIKLYIERLNLRNFPSPFFCRISLARFSQNPIWGSSAEIPNQYFDCECKQGKVAWGSHSFNQI